MKKGCSLVWPDMLPDTTLRMGHTHLKEDILIPNKVIPNKVTRQWEDTRQLGILHPDTLHREDTHQRDTRRRDILPPVDTLQQVMVHQLHTIQGMDLVWERC